jgi:hypothetical protein
MDRCHETSQAPPMEDDVIATTPIQMYHGIAGRDGESKTAG